MIDRINYLTKKYTRKSSNELKHKHDLDYFFNKYHIPKHIRKEVIYIIEDVGHLQKIKGINHNQVTIDQVIGCVTLFVLWSNNHEFDVYGCSLYRREGVSRGLYGRVVSGLLEFYRGKCSVKSGELVEQFNDPIIV